MLNNYQTFANFVEMCMHIKAKTLHFFYAKNLKIVQNQEKAFGVSLNISQEMCFSSKLLAPLHIAQNFLF